jgi:rubrerythrin
MLTEELKKVKGDLQTAEREEVHAKKRLEVEKFSSELDKVSNRADMAASLYKARLNDAKSNLINSVTPESMEEMEMDNEFDITPLINDRDMES